MKRNYIYSYATLLGLTVLTALLAGLSSETSRIVGLLIMALAATKFLVVVYQFMEMKKANGFWKSSITLVCLLIAIIVGVFGKL